MPGFPPKDPFKPALFFGIIITVFFVIHNFIWLSLDNSPPAWDQSYHMALSLKYHRLLSYGRDPISIFRDFFLADHYYPPFFHITTLPVISFLGFSEDNLIFVNFLYLVLFVISMYGIGKILFNRLTGVISAGITFLYPLIYALSHEYLIDFALVAMVTSVQYLILESDGGLKKPWNILLGVMAGLTLLTKPVSIIFFLPSWLFVFFRSFSGKRDLRPLFTTLIIILFISGPWYLSSCRDLMRLNSYSQDAAKMIEGDPTGFIPSILWYVNALKYLLISPAMLVFSGIGLFLFLMFDRRWKVFIHLMIWGIPAFLILVLTPNKDSRYIMPILPVFALFTAGGIFAVRSRGIRNILYGSIFIVGIMQFYDIFFFSLPFLTKSHKHYYNRPSKEGLKVREIVNYISQYAGSKKITVGILSNLPYLNYSNLALYVKLYNFPYTIKRLGDYPVTDEQLRQCDIFITNTPPVSVAEGSFFRNKFYAEFNERGSEGFGFLKIREFDLTDKQKAAVFRNEYK